MAVQRAVVCRRAYVVLTLARSVEAPLFYPVASVRAARSSLVVVSGRW